MKHVLLLLLLLFTACGSGAPNPGPRTPPTPSPSPSPSPITTPATGASDELVMFSTDESMRRLERSQHKVDFFRLANQFEGQEHGGNCGPGMAPCYDYKATYEFKPGGSGPYYNLIVTTTGTKINNKGKPGPAKKREIYVFRDGEYKAGLGK